MKLTKISAIAIIISEPLASTMAISIVAWTKMVTKQQAMVTSNIKPPP